MQSTERAPQKAQFLTCDRPRTVTKNSYLESHKFLSYNNKAVSCKNCAKLVCAKDISGSEENEKVIFTRYLGLAENVSFEQASAQKCSQKLREKFDLNGNITERGRRENENNYLDEMVEKIPQKKVLINPKKLIFESALKESLKIDFEEVMKTFIVVPAKKIKGNETDIDVDSEPLNLRKNVASAEIKLSYEQNVKLTVPIASENSLQEATEEAESATLLNENAIELNYKNDEMIGEDKTVLTVYDSTVKEKYKLEKDLMPWSRIQSRENFKEEKSYEIMKSKQSIMDLYKCMDANCAYTTKFRLFFQSHIEDHQQQGSSMNFFNFCTYCHFICSNPAILALHITKEHSFSKFQCSLCFFRALEKETAHEHMILHHNQQRGIIFRCPGNETKSFEEIRKTAVEMRARFVKPIPCKCE